MTFGIQSSQVSPFLGQEEMEMSAAVECFPSPSLNKSLENLHLQVNRLVERIELYFPIMDNAPVSENMVRSFPDSILSNHSEEFKPKKEFPKFDELLVFDETPVRAIVRKEIEKAKVFDKMSETNLSIVEEFIEAGESYVCAEIMGNIDQLVVGINYSPNFQFPRFDGHDCKDWVFQCMFYFQKVPNIPDKHKITLASLHFEDRAANWFELNAADWFELNAEVIREWSWKRFVGLVCARFENLKEINVLKEFSTLKVEGPLEEYSEKFEQFKSYMLRVNNRSYDANYLPGKLASDSSQEDTQVAISIEARDVTTTAQPKWINEELDELSEELELDRFSENLEKVKEKLNVSNDTDLLESSSEENEILKLPIGKELIEIAAIMDYVSDEQDESTQSLEAFGKFQNDKATLPVYPIHQFLDQIGYGERGKNGRTELCPARFSRELGVNFGHESAKVRQIFDIRGHPTVKDVVVHLSTKILASPVVPSRASTRAYEALELMDGSARVSVQGGGTLVFKNQLHQENQTAGGLESQDGNNSQVQETEILGTAESSIPSGNDQSMQQSSSSLEVHHALRRNNEIGLVAYAASAFDIAEDIRATLISKHTNLASELEVLLIEISSVTHAPTLFPQEYAEEFKYCFNTIPLAPFQGIQEIAQEQFGNVDSVLEYVDLTPIISAFIARVHGARISGAQEGVVIKVLQLEIAAILLSLNFVYVIARILEFLSLDLGRASLVVAVTDKRRSMLEGVDFMKEANNIDFFRRYPEVIGLTRQATAPQVYQEIEKETGKQLQELCDLIFGTFTSDLFAGMVAVVDAFTRRNFSWDPWGQGSLSGGE